MRKKMLSCVATAALCMLVSSDAFARANFPGVLPSSFQCVTCHFSPGGGGARNPFGLAFDDNGQVWDATLCGLDSDGDGASNGAELGDPMCMWMSGDARPTAVSRPGDATSKPPVDEPDMGGDPDMGGEPDMVVAPMDMGGEPADMGVTPADMGTTPADMGVVDMGTTPPPTTQEEEDEGCAQAGMGGKGAGAPALLLGLFGLVGFVRRRR